MEQQNDHRREDEPAETEMILIGRMMGGISVLQNGLEYFRDGLARLIEFMTNAIPDAAPEHIHEVNRKIGKDNRLAKRAAERILEDLAHVENTLAESVTRIATAQIEADELGKFVYIPAGSLIELWSNIARTMATIKRNSTRVDNPMMGVFTAQLADLEALAATRVALIDPDEAENLVDELETKSEMVAAELRAREMVKPAPPASAPGHRRNLRKH